MLSTRSRFTTARLKPASKLEQIAASRRTDFLTVALLVALAAALRFATLHVQSFDEDEAVTIGLLHRSFGKMLGQIPVSEQTPPLYYLLGWLWARVFGFGEVGIRSMSALAGTATVPLAYLAGREFAGRHVALATAALVATNPFLVWYSQEARSYALFAAFAAAGLLFFLRTLRDRRSTDLWLWGGFSALALVTHYFAVFLVLPQAAWLVSRLRHGLPRKAWLPIALPIATGLAVAPLAVAQRSPKKYPFTRLESLQTRILALPRELFAGFGLPSAALWRLAIALLLGFAVVSLLRRTAPVELRVTLRLAGLIVIALAVPVVIALLGLDVVLTRNFIAVLAPCLILASVGYAFSRAGTIAAWALCMVWLAATVVVESDATWQRPPWRQIASALGQPRRDRLIFSLPEPLGVDSLALYLRDHEPLHEFFSRPLREIDFVGIVPAGSETYRRLERISPPLSGFRKLASSDASNYIVLRFASARPYLPSIRNPIVLRDPLRPREPWQDCCAWLWQRSSE